MVLGVLPGVGGVFSNLVQSFGQIGAFGHFVAGLGQEDAQVGVDQLEFAPASQDGKGEAEESLAKRRRPAVGWGEEVQLQIDRCRTHF